MLHEIGTYVPEWVLGFVGGVVFIFALSGLFTAFTNSEDDYNIDLRIEIFKRKIKKKWRKIFKKRKKASKDQKPLKKMDKKEAKEEIKKMFDDEIKE